jgi:hypothetical protein
VTRHLLVPNPTLQSVNSVTPLHPAPLHEPQTRVFHWGGEGSAGATLEAFWVQVGTNQSGDALDDA